ncbi:MAG: DNA recombination protein RmuC [Candidatus Sumerlaeia bacterium]|nr:DNA recombination protein RmuC [Candidatus Sumerlaeia bacterium]
MDYLPLILSGLAFLAAALGAVGSWRRPPAAADPELRTRLDALERRLGEETERLRLALERGLRESTVQFAESQRDLGVQLTAKIEDANAAARRELAETLQAARRSQDERLDRSEAELRKLAEANATASAAMQARLAEFGKTQAEGAAAFAAVLDKAVAESTAASRKELAEALQSARRSQDERLDRAEAALKALSEANATANAAMAARLAEFGAAQAEGASKLGDALRKEIADSSAAARKETSDSLAALRAGQEQAREAQTNAITALQDRVAARLEEMRTGNEKKLETIRETVAEKLQSTLEARLGESFKMVSERLEQVHKGLGEMQTLAQGVGDLKRVLVNVRSRGTFGEVQLEALLEQVLAPAQYERNVATVPGSRERVEFAVRLPGRDRDDSVVYLPIDAKFPQEDYQRLLEALERADADAAAAARKGLADRLAGEARTIRDKYISPPDTTDFAILFLPTEGLYAEALRSPGLVDELQRLRIVIAGPTTLFAILNSLQMGFRTLAIEKRSSEVWQILGAVKTEFGKFGEALDSVGKTLQTATNKITAVQTRTRAMSRKLREVEQLPDAEGAALLGALDDAGGDDE